MVRTRKQDTKWNSSLRIESFIRAYVFNDDDLKNRKMRFFENTSIVC